jgi:hypothetical protein
LGFESGTFKLLSVQTKTLSDPGVAIADVLQPGLVGASVSRTSPLITASEGSFVSLSFVVNESASPRSAAFNLSRIELADHSGLPLSVGAGEPLIVVIEEPVSELPEPHLFDIAIWDLDGSLEPTKAQIINTGSQLALWGANMSGYSAGFRGQAANSNGWMGGTGSGAFWEVRISTQGFTELQLSSRQFGSGSGPRDFLIFGQVGSEGEWIRLTPDTIRVSSSSWNVAHIDALPLPADFDDQSEIGIIWMLASEARIDNGLPMSSMAGTSRIDDIAIRGQQLEPAWVEVWPGDTNNDGMVNADDVLPLGIYWLHNGPKPLRSDSLFGGRTVERWVPEQATYADTNGDGRVDYRDLKWVGLHFGQVRIVDRRISGALTTLEHSGNQTSVYFPGPLFEGDKLVALVHVENLAHQVGGASWRISLGGADSKNLKFSGMDVSGGQLPRIVNGEEELILDFTTQTQAQIHSGILQFHAVDGLHAIEGALVKTGITQLAGAGLYSVLPIELRFVVESDIEQGVEMTLDRLTVSDRNGQLFNITTSAKLKMASEVGVPDDIHFELPSKVTLYPNSPNPFNPTTTLRYTLPEAKSVRISVFDITGRMVQDSDMGIVAPGAHSFRIDASGWSTGVYLYRLTAGAEVRHGKMMLVK